MTDTTRLMSETLLARAELEDWNPATHHTPLGSDELYRLAARILLRLEAVERALIATHLAYRELSAANRDKFGVEEMTAWRILNDIWFKDLFGVTALAPRGEAMSDVSERLTPESRASIEELRQDFRRDLQRAELAQTTEVKIIIQEHLENHIVLTIEHIVEAELQRLWEMSHEMLDGIATLWRNLDYLAGKITIEQERSRIQQIADSLAGSIAAARERVRKAEEGAKI